MKSMHMRDKNTGIDAYDLRVTCIAAGVRGVPGALGCQAHHEDMCVPTLCAVRICRAVWLQSEPLDSLPKPGL